MSCSKQLSWCVTGSREYLLVDSLFNNYVVSLTKLRLKKSVRIEYCRRRTASTLSSVRVDQMYSVASHSNLLLLVYQLQSSLV